MAEQNTQLQQFVGLSVALTGFDAAELWSTGMAQAHFDVVPAIVGPEFLGRLLTRWKSIHARSSGDPEFLDRLMRDELFADDTLGPLARNVARLWYVGMWNQLPAAWRETHGAFAGDVTCYPSPRAYEEGLLWRAIHSHPPAAKQPGFGSWALKPEGADRR